MISYFISKIKTDIEGVQILRRKKYKIETKFHLYILIILDEFMSSLYGL